LLKKSFITGITILQTLYLLYIYAILIPNWGNLEVFDSNGANLQDEVSFYISLRLAE
jgi:hypothetical protein